MTVSDIAIVTEDPKILYYTVRLLRRLNLQFIVLTPNEADVTIAKVFICTAGEVSKFHHISHDRFVLVSDPLEPDVTAIELVMKLLDLPAPYEIVIGVDPGVRFGLVFVADGTRIYGETCSSPFQAARSTKRWSDFVLANLSKCSLIVRVGTGSKLYTTLFLRALRRLHDIFQLELVDERNTTHPGQSDQSSAYLIASRTGRLPSKTDYELDQKDGFIKSLMHLVDGLTEGHVKLSRDDARAILDDRTNLERFLDERF